MYTSQGASFVKIIWISADATIISIKSWFSILGDPDDRTLRVAEEDISIPKFIREKSKEKCKDMQDGNFFLK